MAFSSVVSPCSSNNESTMIYTVTVKQKGLNLRGFAHTGPSNCQRTAFKMAFPELERGLSS